MNMIDMIRGSVDDTSYISGREQKDENLQESFSQLVDQRRMELIARIRSGKEEESIAIGAGSYTDSEWKRLLRSFDAIQEELRRSKEHVKREEDETKGTGVTNHSEHQEKSVELLLAELTTAAYPSSDPEGEDIMYITYYLPDGIYCRKQGQEGFEWQIPLEDGSQYEKVMAFLRNFDPQDNLRFACHENFWRDFLADEIDIDGFRNFLESRVVDGVPNYLNIYEEGANIDSKAASYSKYMNVPDFVKDICYTSEEAMETFVRNGQVDEKKQPAHEVIDLNHMDQYYAKHPDEIGKRNHYYRGKWYSFAELAQVWQEELEELFSQKSSASKSSPKFTVDFR